MPKGIFIRSKLHNKNIAISKIGEKNGMWKGNKAGYFAIHEWVNRRLGKITKCDKYSTTKPKRYELALKKGHKCERNLFNWFKLCRSCHFKYDEIEKKFNTTGRFKLKKEQVLEIYSKYKNRKNRKKPLLSDIGDIYGVKRKIIRLILKKEYAYL